MHPVMIPVRVTLIGMLSITQTSDVPMPASLPWPRACKCSCFWQSQNRDNTALTYNGMDVYRRMTSRCLNFGDIAGSSERHRQRVCWRLAHTSDHMAPCFCARSIFWIGNAYSSGAVCSALFLGWCQRECHAAVAIIHTERKGHRGSQVFDSGK